MHEDGLARPQRETIEQLERGRAGQRNRGRLDHVEGCRARADPTRLEPDVVGVRTPAGAANRTHAPNRVPADEPLNPETDLLDPSRELIPDHVRRFDPGPTRVGTVARIDRIHSGRPDTNDNAPR